MTHNRLFDEKLLYRISSDVLVTLTVVKYIHTYIYLTFNVHFIHTYMHAYCTVLTIYVGLVRLTLIYNPMNYVMSKCCYLISVAGIEVAA